MLVEVTDFVGEIALPFDMRNIKETKLCKFIDQYEPVWKRYALGYDFYKLFETALAGTPDARWVLLRDGGDWNYNGEVRRFGGVRPLIRAYVYYWYMRNEATITTYQGEKSSKSEHTTSASPTEKAAQQFNNMWLEMAETEGCLWGMLQLAQDDDGATLYPEFDLCRVDIDRFKTINPII